MLEHKVTFAMLNMNTNWFSMFNMSGTHADFFTSSNSKVKSFSKLVDVLNFYHFCFLYNGVDKQYLGFCEACEQSSFNSNNYKLFGM